eukprot:c5720_g1_i1.p1 GENE.c5720_g1_i1~~c5720_g1_i1.p1  ORF type:complete len:279 (+),score=35.02 c5720_g1_i1:42-878(+)
MSTEGSAHIGQNTWVAALLSDDTENEAKILFWTVVVIIVHFLSKRLGNWYGYPLSIRPTIINSTAHAVVVTVTSVLWLSMGRDYYPLWLKHSLPYTLGYFVADNIIYSIPQKDYVIFIHHTVVFLACYPWTDKVGLYLVSCHEPLWVNSLGMWFGLIEIGVVLLNTRWWLSQTLEKHSPIFTLIAVLTVVAFSGRLVLCYDQLMNQILPRYNQCAEAGQLLSYFSVATVVTTVFILSAYWLVKIVLSPDFFFFKKRERSNAPFSFTSDSFKGTNKKSD